MNKEHKLIKVTYTCDGCGNEASLYTDLKRELEFPLGWYRNICVMHGHTVIAEPLACCLGCVIRAVPNAIQRWVEENEEKSNQYRQARARDEEKRGTTSREHETSRYEHSVGCLNEAECVVSGCRMMSE